MHCTTVAQGAARSSGRSDEKRLDAGQGVAALVGITFGVVPLVQLALGRGPGLWTAVGLDGAGSSALLACSVVVVLAITVIGWLEVLERRR